MILAWEDIIALKDKTAVMIIYVLMVFIVQMEVRFIDSVQMEPTQIYQVFIHLTQSLIVEFHQIHWIFQANHLAKSARQDIIV